MKINKRSLRNIFFLCMLFEPVIPCQGFSFCYSDLSIELRAGVAPTFWLDRGEFAAISCQASSRLDLPTPYIPLFTMPSFKSLFGTPWYIGARVGYSIGNGQEIYAELNYRQSRARTLTLNPLIIPTIDILNFTIAPKNNYHIIDSYIGIRFHRQMRWCEALEVFVGGKMGVMHHAKVKFVFTSASLMTPAASPFVSPALPLFFSNTVPAIGGHIGLNYAIHCDFDFVLTAELLASCGPRANPNIPFDLVTQSEIISPALAPNSFIVGDIGTEIAVPITIGCKYRF